MHHGLELRDLGCQRGRRRLFQGLNAALAPGQLLRVSGANGAGKTSLLRMLCGLLQPSQGQVLWQGRSVHREREALLRELVYIGHGAALKDDLSALENLQAAARLAGLAPDEAAARQALAAHQPLELMFLRLTSEDQSALFAYQHRFLDPTEIKQVGPRALKVSASAQ